MRNCKAYVSPFICKDLSDTESKLDYEFGKDLILINEPRIPIIPISSNIKVNFLTNQTNNHNQK